jgi:Methylmalonyl Co-A mutase-associated GTPase MeaB
VTTTGGELGARLREGDLTAAPAVLNLVESRGAHEEVAALLREVSPAALGGEAPAHVVGVTGPPGAGKSTLLGELVRAWRADGRSVAVLAVDPSSRRSGGALLGDRDTEVVAVSSVPPASGVDELVAALDAHRERLDLGARRLAARRASALADFAAEHGERGLRALGGRRAAERALGETDPGADVPALVATLEERADG